MPKYRSIPCSYEVIEGRRRNSRIYVSNGFGYVKSSLLGEKRMYMRCMESRRCNAKAVLALDSQMLFHKQPHNHPPSPENFIRIKLYAALKRKAEQTNTKVSKLYMDELKKMNIENPSALGLNYDKIAASMYKRRNKITKECNQGTASSRHFFGPPETLYDGNLPVVEGITYQSKIEHVSDDHHLLPLSEDFLHFEFGEESQEEPALHDRVEDKSPNSEVSRDATQSMSGTSKVHSAPAEQLFNKTINVLKTKTPVESADIQHGTQKAGSYQLEHNNHLHLVLSQLAQDEVFMDVTLTAEGKQIKAHKSVLSAVSPYFSAVLRANPCQHPIIIMPAEVRYEQLSSILSFIYRGDVTVRADELLQVMKVAELLLITSLTLTDKMEAVKHVTVFGQGKEQDELARQAVPEAHIITSEHHSHVKSNASSSQTQAAVSKAPMLLHQHYNVKTLPMTRKFVQELSRSAMSPTQCASETSDLDDDDDGFNPDFLDSPGSSSPASTRGTEMCSIKQDCRVNEPPQHNNLSTTDDGHVDLLEDLEVLEAERNSCLLSLQLLPRTEQSSSTLPQPVPPQTEQSSSSLPHSVPPQTKQSGSSLPHPVPPQTKQSSSSLPNPVPPQTKQSSSSLPNPVQPQTEQSSSSLPNPVLPQTEQSSYSLPNPVPPKIEQNSSSLSHPAPLRRGRPRKRKLVVSVRDIRRTKASVSLNNVS